MVDDSSKDGELRVDTFRDFYRGIIVLKYSRLGVPKEHEVKFVEDGSNFRHHIVWRPVERNFSLWRKLKKISQPHWAYRKIALTDVIKIDAPHSRSKVTDVCDEILARVKTSRSAEGNDFENLYAVITKSRSLVLQFKNPLQRNSFRDFIGVRLSIIFDARRIEEENALMTEEEAATRKWYDDEMAILMKERKDMQLEDTRCGVEDTTVAETNNRGDEEIDGGDEEKDVAPAEGRDTGDEEKDGEPSANLDTSSNENSAEIDQSKNSDVGDSVGKPGPGDSTDEEAVKVKKGKKKKKKKKKKSHRIKEQKGDNDGGDSNPGEQDPDSPKKEKKEKKKKKKHSKEPQEE